MRCIRRQLLPFLVRYQTAVPRVSPANLTVRPLGDRLIWRRGVCFQCTALDATKTRSKLLTCAGFTVVSAGSVTVRPVPQMSSVGSRRLKPQQQRHKGAPSTSADSETQTKTRSKLLTCGGQVSCTRCRDSNRLIYFLHSL